MNRIISSSSDHQFRSFILFFRQPFDKYSTMTEHLQFYLIPLLFITFTSFLLLFFIKKKTPIESTDQLPPGPKKLPLIGNLHQLGNSTATSLQRLSDKYGPLMFLQLGSVPTLVISSADAAKHIFKTHDVVLSNRPELYVARKVSYNFNDIAFAPYGEYWRQVRKIVTLELFSSKRVQSFQEVRKEEVASMLECISRSLPHKPVDLSKLTLFLANNVVCRVTFGKKYDGSDASDSGVSRFNDLLYRTQTLLGEVCLSDFFPWMEWVNRFNGKKARVDKACGELDELYEGEIKEHRDPNRVKAEHEDLIDVLLRVQKDPSQGILLSNEQIKGLLADMFIAGTDTSAATLVWTMTELIKKPSILTRAQNEVRQVAKGKQMVEESDIPKLIYLKSVLKESFRLHPSVPLLVPRETMDDFTIGSYRIPSKTRVFINAKSIGTDPKYWENPNEFRPERFLNSSVDFRGQHFELMPFGIGRRSCPGMNFGVALVEIALANLLHRFDWRLPQGMTIDDLDMEEASGITTHKKSLFALSLFLLIKESN